MSIQFHAGYIGIQADCDWQKDDHISLPRLAPVTDSTGFGRAPAPDRARVTVRLWKGERASVFGEIIPPQKIGYVQMAIRVTGPRPPAEALAVATVLSRNFNCDIVVVDDENLWHPAWGTLV
jgi:hypothetical protein